MKASEDALLNEAKASAVANDAIIPRRPHRGGGLEGVSPQPIKNREAFFGFLKFGLQRYFNRYDNTYSGVISLTIGVRDGRVLGIAKNEGLFDYEKGGAA